MNAHATRPRILAFGGALRRDSLNQKLAARAADGAREAGADVTVIALRDFPLPMYDFDLQAAGGLRGLVPLRMLLANIGVTVLPDQVTVPNASSAFTADGRVSDEKLDARVRALGATLARHLARHLA